MGTFTNSEDPDEMPHDAAFHIRVYTVCYGKMDLQTKKTIFFENYNLTSLDMYNGLSQVYCIKPEGSKGLINYSKFHLLKTL